MVVVLTDETKASFFGTLRSKNLYEMWIGEYKKWAEENVVEDREDAFSALEFLKSLEGRYAATSWTIYSILHKSAVQVQQYWWMPEQLV